jgi:hypothetical protein
MIFPLHYNSLDSFSLWGSAASCSARTATLPIFVDRGVRIRGENLIDRPGGYITCVSVDQGAGTCTLGLGLGEGR